MARVLIFHQALPPYRVDLFNYIGLHHETKLVLLQRNLISQPFDQAQLTQKLNLPYSYLDKGFRFLNKNFRTGIYNEINKFNPDIIVVPEFSPTTIAVILMGVFKRNFKVVVWTDDNTNSIRSESRGRYIARSLAIRSIDGLILASDSALDIYRSTSVEKCVSPILQNETNFRGQLALSLPGAQEKASALGLYGKKIFLFVGRLVKEKRVDRLLKYFKTIQSQYPDSHLVIVGDGPLKENLTNLTHQLEISNAVYFAGRAEGLDLLSWYAIGQIFFLLSEYEQFGAVVNEALIAGIPTICSSAAGARILITEGVNGHIVDPADINAVLHASVTTMNYLQPLAEISLIRMKESLMTTTFEESSSAVCKMFETLGI